MKKDRGFIQTIIIVIIALAALKYFWDWSIFEAAETEEGQGTIAYIKQILNYLKNFIVSLWNKII